MKKFNTMNLMALGFTGGLTIASITLAITSYNPFNDFSHWWIFGGVSFTVFCVLLIDVIKK